MLLTLISLGAGFVSAAEAQQPSVFEVVIPASSLKLAVNGPAGIRRLGQLQGTMTAQANGIACITADLSSMTSDVTLHLGLPGQPAACSMDGAKVTFFNARCIPLSAEMVLTRGTRQVLQNLAPAAPGSTPSSPGCLPNPTPTGGISMPPGLRPDSPTVPQERLIVPPDTGDAGLAAIRE